MATTASGDVKIYNPQFQGAFVETLQQNVDAFNEVSRGTITLQTMRKKGQYDYEAFFDEVSSIARRDPSADSSSSLTPTKLTQDEFISVKLHRNQAHEWNISAGWLAGFDPAEFSVAVGRMSAVAVPKEMLDRALAACEAKLDAVSALEHDATDGTLAITDLSSGLAKFGDKAGMIRMFVMHSKPWFDLLNSQLTSTATVIGSDPFGNTIYEGVPATLGRPVIVTDSASLISYTDVSSGQPIYSTLGLAQGAINLELTELPLAVAEGPKTGAANLYITFQSEYGYNLGIRGCAWDTSSGANPTNAAVATGSNWVTKVADNKLLPGVLIRSQ